VREDLRQRPELRALRRRAYEELDLAIDQSGGELPRDWLSKGDHDLEPLRTLDEPEWQLLVLRATGPRARRYPQHPGAAWGDPHQQRNEWVGVAVILAIVATVVLVAFLPDDALLVLAALVALSGVGLLWMLARNREVILGAIVLVAGVIFVLTLLPGWLVIVLALFAGSLGAVLMALRARAAAKAAEARAVALWDLRKRDK
jgi:hypothetical protein